MSANVKNIHLAGLLQRVDTQNERIQELAGSLSKAQLEWIPLEGGWGVGKILEHLISSTEMYYDVLPDRIQKARQSGQLDQGAEWKRSMMGNFLIKSIEGPRKVKTFKRFDPKQVGDRVVERMLEGQSCVAGFIRDADGLNLNKVRKKSPMLGLIRYNLADCFAIIVFHTDRHLNRVDELTKMAEFPTTAAV